MANKIDPIVHIFLKENLQHTTTHLIHLSSHFHEQQCPILAMVNWF